MTSDAYALEPDDVVGCYYCMDGQDHRSYVRGQAVLAGPGVPPWDANANMLCLAHIDDKYTVWDGHEEMTVAAYKVQSPSWDDETDEPIDLSSDKPPGNEHGQD